MAKLTPAQGRHVAALWKAKAFDTDSAIGLGDVPDFRSRTVVLLLGAFALVDGRLRRTSSGAYTNTSVFWLTDAGIDAAERVIA